MYRAVFLSIPAVSDVFSVTFPVRFMHIPTRSNTSRDTRNWALANPECRLVEEVKLCALGIGQANDPA